MYPKKTEVSQQKSPGPSLHYQDHRGRQFEAGRPEVSKLEGNGKKCQWIPPCLPGLLDQGKYPRRVLHWGLLVQVPFLNSSRGPGDSLAKESIRSYFCVDYGKIEVDHSGGDSLRDSDEEQSKVVKLQHRKWMRRTASTT
jgi:hypothetical protein